jgi:hypothetical protein
MMAVDVHTQQQQRGAFGQVAPGCHLPGHLQQPAAEFQQLTCEPGGGGLQTKQSGCPESRSLYKQLVSQLSLAACEAQMEHMAIRSAPSTSSTCSSLSAISRGNSISWPPSELSSRPGSSSSTASPLSTDAFQSLLFMMLEEELAAAAHTQGPTHSE